MQVDFQELKRLVPITKVMELLNLTLKQEGKQLRGQCPICVSKNPRAFVVTPDKGLWFCHSCTAGGDQLKLVALIRNTDIRSAAIEIQERTGTVSQVPTVHASNTAPSSTIGARRAQGFDAEKYASRLDPAH